MFFGEMETSDNKVLTKQLSEKLNAYLQELPVLGFNSGKYDLNAEKEFVFPHLIETQTHQVHCQDKRQSYVSQDRLPQTPGYLQLCSTWFQL